jgi:hypothetical protein
VTEQINGKDKGTGDWMKEGKKEYMKGSMHELINQ